METKIAVKALAALAQETRLAVYRLLVQQGPSGLAAGELAEQLRIPPATLSFHLKELSNAGLVQARQSGRYVFYSADFTSMSGLLAFLTENCCGGEDCGQPAAACKPVSAGRAKKSRAGAR